MTRVFRLILILALSFGAVIAPDVSAVNAAEAPMAQMVGAEGADNHCGGCDPIGFADGISCEGGCPVPCGAGSMAGIVARTSAMPLEVSFGVVIPVAEPVIPIGAITLLDPFPPKQPV
ncbi:hypothetical protein VWZ88_18900 [Phaeobacter sp. JH20_36]|uniref:hypothetical protein n=1 Tax=unclassified Phaeobacter TaxID=2621772 RepID=UPI003A843732